MPRSVKVLGGYSLKGPPGVIHHLVRYTASRLYDGESFSLSVRSARPLSPAEAEELAGLVEVERKFDTQVSETFDGIPSEIATHLLRVARKLTWEQSFSATIVPQPRKEWPEPQEYAITLSASGLSVLGEFENLFKEFTPYPSGLHLKGVLLQSEPPPPTILYHLSST